MCFFNANGRIFCFRKQKHKCPYVFMRRRGAWARPNAPSSQDAERTRKGARTQTEMLIHLYEEEMCMGKPETLPRHKTTECTRMGTRTQPQMLVRLYDKERCMGTPEMLPCHKTTERTRRGQEQNKTQIIGWRKQYTFSL